MPAQSQQQQKLFGLALAFKRGEVPSSEVSDEIKAIADRMSEKDIEDFASTKHKGLPKMKEQLRSIVREIMREKVISEMESVVNEGKFKVDDLVYNKRTKTIGIVRMGDDKYGEVKTDADGNVSVDELEKYNPIKFKHQTNAKVAPSTEKEVNKRGLFNPFKMESVNEVASRTAMEIGALTGLNKNAVQDFVDKHELDIEKLYKGVRSMNLAGRMNLVTAIAGKPGNSLQKLTIKLNKKNESVNEAVITYGIEYKSSKNDRKFKKASLTKTTHNPNIDKMMIKAISKDAKSLAKQDGWVDYRITKDGVPVKESVNEGASTEEKRIVMEVIKKIAKYRNVPIDYAVGDVIRAAEELERDIQKGKVK
jgi:hypothetical protein